MGSSILRCFSSYYGLIMWLISTRWPQRDKRPQGLDLLKLSLSGCFFSSSPIYLYGSAQKHRRRFLGACTMRRTPAHFCLIWVRESELLNICGNFVVCARACACILTKWRNRARARRTVRPWHSAAPCTPDLSRATHPPSFSWHILALRPGLSPELPGDRFQVQFSSQTLGYKGNIKRIVEDDFLSLESEMLALADLLPPTFVATCSRRSQVSYRDTHFARGSQSGDTQQTRHTRRKIK